MVFSSVATNLVGGDTNAREDIFVRDRKLNTTTRVSASDSLVQASGNSTKPSISCDGSLIAFMSDATDLVANDTNARRDVFIVNRIGGHSIKNVTQGANNNSGLSDAPIVSCDGSTVVYASNATNLVAGDTNAATNIFAYDVNSETTTRVSVSSSSAEASAYDWGFGVSGDGAYVVFSSVSSSLVAGDTNAQADVFLRDRIAGTTEIVSKRNPSTQTTSWSRDAGISPDGQYVTFISPDSGLVTSDTNDAGDIFKSATGGASCSL